VPLRLLAQGNRSCCGSRASVFLGTRVLLRLLAQGNRSCCGSRASVFLGAQEGALSLLEHVGRAREASWDQAHFLAFDEAGLGVGGVCGGGGGGEGRQDTRGESGQKM
jgi:hypothetical protein